MTTVPRMTELQGGYVPSSSIRRIRLALIALALSLSVTRRTAALEVPPASGSAFIQTSGPATPLTIGDWYSSNTNGVGHGSHFFPILIPAGWPTNQPVYVDLLSPELNTTSLTNPIDEDHGSGFGNTQYEMYHIGTVVNPLTLHGQMHGGVAQGVGQ
ncbi:molybdopterin-dependent oxidoreductase, partial [Candidatus Sumerlaeota bacterium]|nr:molybdopterin-dependent oxidoreductase [Candidatus Sumerlaeota bacterium]